MKGDQLSSQSGLYSPQFPLASHLARPAGAGGLNVLVVAEGTSGDLHPLLGLSSVLANQGHSVTF